MKLLRAVPLTTLLIVSAFPAHAQFQLMLDVTLRPDPVIAHWQNHPEYATLRIVNMQSAPIQAKLHAVVSRNGAVEAETKTDRMQALSIPPGQSVYFANQLFPAAAVVFSNDIDRIVATTGTLPEGEHVVCIGLVDPVTGVSLSEPPCRPISLMSYQPPVLLQPDNEHIFSINNFSPLFVWAGVVPLPPYPVQYRVRIVEVVTGQTPERALRENNALVDNIVTGTTQFLWPPGLHLPRPMRCAWTVQALDDMGAPLGTNEGMAPPFLFDCRADSGAAALHDSTRALAVNDSARDLTHEIDSAHIPTTTTTPGTPVDCACAIEKEWLGGPPIEIVNNIAVHPAVRLRQGFGVGLSAYATDNDILVQKCILGGVREKFLKDVGDPVYYAWKVEAGDPAALIGKDGSSVIYALPPTLGENDSITVTVSCTISSANDDDIHGSVTFTVRGADTCGLYDLRTDITPLKKGSPHTREPELKGTCIPGEDIWIAPDGITASLSVPRVIPAGQMVLLQCTGTDPDHVEIQCTSNGCGNPKKLIDLDDPLVCSWDDGGAGGSFPLGATGSSVIYIAPADATKKTVTFTCKIKDSGTHRKASTETTEKSATAELIDALQAVNVSIDGALKTYVTVGSTQRLEPQLDSRATVSGIDWCTNIGGKTGAITCRARSDKSLTNATAALRFDPTITKDDALTVGWKNHSHVHARHTLACCVTFTVPGIPMFYQDNIWTASNFLISPGFTEYGLFFIPDAKNDDGGWRADKAENEDHFGAPARITGTNAMNFLPHWSKDTYAPHKHSYPISGNDPTNTFGDELGGGCAGALACYQWMDNVNNIDVSPKAMTEIKTNVFHSTTSFVGSDNQWIAGSATLPAYNVKGIQCATKVMRHELAHWEAMTDNWSAHGKWFLAYGARTTDSAEIFHATVAKGADWKQTSAPAPNKGKFKDAAPNLSLNITMGVHTVSVAHGWVKEGKIDGKSYVFVSQREGAVVDGTPSRNGIIVVRKAQELTVYERANDPDNDRLPNATEDDIGTSWQMMISYPTFREKWGGKDNGDSEFWAEYISKEVVETKFDKEKDWSNPGMQTER